MQQYRKNLGKVSLTAEGVWDGSKAFDILSIVYDEHTQHGFISRQAVPEGVDLYNKEYWMPFNVSGYADNNIIILSKKTAEHAIQSYTLEEAIASIRSVGRRPGAILGFYNENADRLDIGGRWELWQFNDTNVYNWDNVDSWQNLYYNYNKFMGWFKDENFLNKYVPFPEIGCYAFVGSEFNEATVYRCDNKYVWNNTTQHAWDYVKVVVDGNVTVGENGNWFNDGKDTGIPASVKGENGKTPVFREKDNTIQYSFDNVNWITISDKVAAWFRWNATTGDTQTNNVGRIQISRDNVTWTNLSGDIINNLHISRYIGVDESLPTSGIAEGTIYAKGPSYDENDASHANPIYRLWVYAWKGNTLAWQDNGEFTSIAAGVVQETGDSETEVMSQAAVTRELSELGSNVSLGLFNVDVDSFFSNNEQIYSNYIEAKQGDLITFTAKVDSTNLVLGEYDSNKTLISAWTNPDGSKIINLEKENTAYIRVIYDKYKKNQFVTKNGITVSKYNYTEEILSLLNSRLLGINNNIIGSFVSSNIFDVKIGDIIEWRSDLATTANTLLQLDENYNKIDQWTSPDKYRKIVMENNSCKYIQARFNPYSSNIQYLSINNVIVADFIDNRLKKTNENMERIYNAPPIADLFDSGIIFSKFIPCTKGDIVTFSTQTDNTNFPFKVYDANFIYKDGYTNPDGIRTIVIENENFAFVQAKYDINEQRPQYIKINNNIVSELKPNDYNISLLNNKIDNNINIPDWVQTEAFKTFSRMINYTNSNSFVLAQITDVHSGGNNKYKHVGYLNELNKVWSFNVLCNAGDIGLDVGETDDNALKLMYNTKSLMNCTSPWLFCKGNHERLRTMSELGNVFMKPSRRQFPNIVFGDNNGLYGYIDDEISKVRTVYLNTSDTDSQSSYAISDEQIVWLGNTLFSTNDDYKVVILTHLCPKQIGEWTDYPGDWETASNLVKVIEGFAQRLSVFHAGVTWNYSNKLAKIVCVLSGDSHFNNFTKDNGVNYIVRQGYGGISEESKPEGATSDNFSYTTQCLFDILVIKDNSIAKVFRIGAGGEARDLEITF